MNTLLTPGTVNETMPKTVDPNESRSEWVTLSNRTSLFFWSIDGQDELRELETYSDAPMPLIDIAGVYIISDKRQKHLRSSVPDLSLSDLSWSSFHFFHFTHNLLYLSVYLFFMTCFLTCFPLASLGSCRRECVCVSVCVFLCSSSSGFWLEMQSWFFTTFTFTMKTKW